MPKGLRQILLIFTVLSFIGSPSSAAAAAGSCSEIFIRTDMDLTRSVASEASHRTAEVAEKIMTQRGMFGPRAKGFAILIGAMVGSAFLTTVITSRLGTQFQFLSLFVAQIAAIGVYQWGAPIWEPISSHMRQLAFAVKKDKGPGPKDGNKDQRLEALWLQTQENYSLNSQMSRNVINQFIISIKQNFYEAYRASVSDNPTYAASQVAEAAFRLRVLFREVPPQDISVTMAVRWAFTDHVQVDQKFVLLVLGALKKNDPDFLEHSAYYRSVLTSWLNLTEQMISIDELL